MVTTPAYWDARYADADYLFGTAPARFLSGQAGYLTAGATALAVADGEGRNSVFMAEKGLQVTAMDASTEGLAKARKLAGARKVQVAYHQHDILTWDWSQTYDVVVAVFIQFLDPANRALVFQGLKTAIAPGGTLLLHGYRPEQLSYGTGGPPHAENMYTTDLLAEAFADLDVLRLEAYDAEVQEGRGHSGMSALIDLVARKPL